MNSVPLIVSFFGEDEVSHPKIVYKNLFKELEKRLFQRYKLSTGRERIFLCGGTGEFDEIVKRVLRALKRIYPDVPIQRVLCTPFPEAYPLKGLHIYYDKILPLLAIGWKDQQIEDRDKSMITLSELVIGYVRQSQEKGKKLLEYAKENAKTIKLISDNPSPRTSRRCGKNRK